MEKIVTIELKIPNLGEAESTEIIEVNIEDGSEINENDPLIVLESEKAAMEIPSDFKGKVIEVFVKEGDSVTEGQVYAKIESIKVDQSSNTPNEEKSREIKENINQTKYEPNADKVDFSGINAGPAVRKYSRELAINLAVITGTGRNGRVTKDDLKNYIHAKTSQEVSYPNEEDFRKFGNYKVEKLTKIRALGAKNMSASWASIPHVTHFEEAEMTAINDIRSKEKASPLAFFVRIIALAISQHKIFNSSLLQNDQILIKDYVNIGIAVDTPDGLVVPVIKDALNKNVQEISEEISVLAEKARNKKLLTKDLEGSTFTISSLGKIGGTGFTPIINPPEVAIIALSRSKNILRMVKGKPAEIEVIPFSLSYDHRVINGADAGRFMDKIRDMIENYT